MESIPRKANPSIHPSSLESYHMQIKLTQDYSKKPAFNMNSYETPTIRTIEKVDNPKPRVKSENQSIKGNMNQSIKLNRLTTIEGNSREKLQERKPILKSEPSGNSINKLPPRTKINNNQKSLCQNIKNQSPSQRISPNFNTRILNSVNSDSSDTEDQKKLNSGGRGLNIKVNTSEKSAKEIEKKPIISDITNGISPRINTLAYEKPLNSKFKQEKIEDENSSYSNYGTRDSVKYRKSKDNLETSNTCSEKTEEEIKYKETQQTDKNEIHSLKLNIFSLEEKNKLILEEASKIRNEANSAQNCYQENIKTYKSEIDNLKKALIYSEEENRKTKENLIKSFEMDKRKLQEEFYIVSNKNESNLKQELNKLKEEKIKSEILVANLTSQLEKQKLDRNSEVLSKAEFLKSEISKFSYNQEQLKAYLIENIQTQYNFFTSEINKLQTSYENALKNKSQQPNFSDDIEIYKLKNEDFKRQIAAIQRNNSDIAMKLQQTTKEFEAYKEKYQKDQKEWNEEKIKMTNNIICLDKLVHTCTDPEKIVYETKIQELEKNYKLSYQKLIETEKELRYWKTGVKDTQEEHIKNLETKIFMLSDERDELKEKLLISLES
jgi:hypothetical protein